MNQLTTSEFLRGKECRILAEIGVANGYTSEAFAQFLNGHGELHLFDFDERVEYVKRRLTLCGYENVISHGNSHKRFDSYNWSLMKLLKGSTHPIFDYVYLDGAHTWHHDACAFFLVDKLLKNGGYIEFDDYAWTYSTSPTVNPRVFPEITQLYTEEQINTSQVALIVDLLVKMDPRYETVVPNRIYQKRS